MLLTHTTFGFFSIYWLQALYLSPILLRKKFTLPLDSCCSKSRSFVSHPMWSDLRSLNGRGPRKDTPKLKLYPKYF